MTNCDILLVDWFAGNERTFFAVCYANLLIQINREFDTDNSRWKFPETITLDEGEILLLVVDPGFG